MYIMRFVVKNIVRNTGDSHVVTIPSYLIKKGFVKEGDLVETISINENPDDCEE